MRDCISSIGGPSRKECLANSDFCKTCDKRVCNRKMNFPKCYTGEWSSKICTNYNDVCFTHYIGEYVIKGCFQEYVQENKLSNTFKEDNAKNPLFTTCSTPMCNTDSDLVVDTDYGNEDNNQFDVSSEDENTDDEYSDYEDNNTNNEQITEKNKITDGTGDDPVIDGNDVVKIEPQCYECDSQNDKRCKSNLNDEMRVVCSSESRETRGCFHIITGES